MDRRMGPPQWADLGIYLQTVMLLATEQGLGTCAQEYWRSAPSPCAHFWPCRPERLLFAGLALGWPDEGAAINQWRSERDPFAAWGRCGGLTEAPSQPMVSRLGMASTPSAISRLRRRSTACPCSAGSRHAARPGR
jgi:hypothetical protein